MNAPRVLCATCYFLPHGSTPLVAKEFRNAHKACLNPSIMCPFPKCGHDFPIPNLTNQVINDTMTPHLLSHNIPLDSYKLYWKRNRSSCRSPAISFSCTICAFAALLGKAPPQQTIQAIPLTDPLHWRHSHNIRGRVSLACNPCGQAFTEWDEFMAHKGLPAVRLVDNDCDESGSDTSDYSCCSSFSSSSSSEEDPAPPLAPGEAGSPSFPR